MKKLTYTFLVILLGLSQYAQAGAQKTQATFQVQLVINEVCKVDTNQNTTDVNCAGNSLYSVTKEDKVKKVTEVDENIVVVTF